MDDRKGLRGIASNYSNITVFGDKGYVGEALAQELEKSGIRLMALKRSNSKSDWPKHVRRLIFRMCRRVEIAFSKLSGQLNAKRTLAKSFQGLCVRLANKALAYNLYLALNRLFDEKCEI